MPSDLRWGIGVPQIFPDGPIDMSLVRRWIPRAEQLGFDSLWTMEGITGDLPTLEPVTLLSYMSALTERVKLGVSVIIAPHRNPVQLAKALGSLDTINNGRLIVGIGLGHRVMSDTFGISAEHRVSRFVEIMDVMKALWTQPQADYSGRFWRLENTPMEPKPVQKPHPPIWLGGGHPNVLRRGVRHADGWMGAGASSTSQFVENMGRLRTYLDEAGRDPSTFAVSKRVYLAIDTNEEPGRIPPPHLVWPNVQEPRHGQPGLCLGKPRHLRREAGRSSPCRRPHDNAQPRLRSHGTPGSLGRRRHTQRVAGPMHRR